MFYISNIKENYITSEKYTGVNIHNSSRMPIQYYEIRLPLMINYLSIHDTSCKENPYINFCIGPDFYAYYSFQESELSITGNNLLPHQHNFYELNYVVNGSITMKIENEICTFPTGSAFLVNKYVEHTEISYKGLTSILQLQLTEDFVRQLLVPYSSFLFTSEQDASQNPLVHYLISNLNSHNTPAKDFLDFFPKSNTSDLYTLCFKQCENIMSSLLYGAFGYTHLIKGQICNLFSILGNADNYNITKIDLSKNNESVIFTRITQLFENTNGRISRSELSDILNYNGIYLNSIVKKFTGMSTFEYGMTYCLAKAANLLIETDQSIAEITAELHFTNRTHFYKLFRKQYGITPKEYRLQKGLSVNDM